MNRREGGQVTVAAVGIVLLLGAAIAVLVHLALIRSQGAHGQSAADVAALAAAQVLEHDPAASDGAVRAAAVRAAKANGATLERLQIDRTAAIADAVDVAVTETASGSVPAVGERRDVVWLRSRAGVTYPDPPSAGGPAPVDLHGLVGANAIVRAAEAQIGWPYVWGGESRAEGGFDCSGLVDYAYAAAGHALPGRPTSESLWAMAQHIQEDQLAPGDLVFLGSASGAPYHVGMYAGEGLVVVAPHTGANVRLEPLSAGGWDGFGRLIPGNAQDGLVSDPVEQVARRYNLPPTVLQAALNLHVIDDPTVLAQRLAAAMHREHGSVADALAAVLGSKSLAGAVYASMATTLPAGGGVELLPRMQIRWRVPAYGGGINWKRALKLGRAVTGYAAKLSEVHDRSIAAGDPNDARLTPSEHASSGLAVGLAVLNYLPVGDGVKVTGQLIGAAAPLPGLARKAAAWRPGMVSGVAEDAEVAGKLTLALKGGGGALALVGCAISVAAMYRARRWGGANGRLINAAAALSNGVFVAALLGCTIAPPVLLGAAVVLAAITVIQHWDTIKRWGGEAWNLYSRGVDAEIDASRWVASTTDHVATRVASTVTDTAGKAASAVRSAASSGAHKIASALGF